MPGPLLGSWHKCLFERVLQNIRSKSDEQQSRYRFGTPSSRKNPVNRADGIEFTGQNRGSAEICEERAPQNPFDTQLVHSETVIGGAIVMLLESFLDWNVEGNRVHDTQTLELHPDAVHAGTRKCHVELDVLPGTA